MQFTVCPNIYPPYTCRRCETIVAEPAIPMITDRDMAAPGLPAQIAIQKYADYSPLCRLEGPFSATASGLCVPLAG